jgi:hypothetical protein
MSLDEQLAELLGRLGVVLEDNTEAASAASTSGASPHARDQCQTTGRDTDRDAGDDEDEGEMICPTCLRASETGALGDRRAPSNDGPAFDQEACGLAEVSLFQTSREHYGVFYRLDLIAGVPQLRIFSPEEHGALKMRCFLVRPAECAPMRVWFAATRGHDGSAAYEETRETTEQHLLFAAGETLKRLFWAGEQDEMRFPTEILVQRLA